MTSVCETRRRILCVFPRYAPSFGTFEYAFPLTDGVRGFMPPQGLLVVAAALPASWEVRFIDENIGPASTEDFHWADAVFVSGMHLQQRQGPVHGRCADIAEQREDIVFIHQLQRVANCEIGLVPVSYTHLTLPTILLV